MHGILPRFQYFLNGPSKPLPWFSLDYIARSACIQCTTVKRLSVVGRHNDDEHSWELGLDATRSFDAIQPGHGDIHHYEVGDKGPRKSDGLKTVRCLTHDLQIRDQLELLASRMTRQEVVVHHQHPKRPAIIACG